MVSPVLMNAWQLAKAAEGKDDEFQVRLTARLAREIAQQLFRLHDLDKDDRKEPWSW